MSDTIAFPTSYCDCCTKQVLVAQDLDASDALIDVCVHCDTPIAVNAQRRHAGGYALKALGYTLVEEDDGGGCGTGGCGTGGGGCGTAAC